MMEEEFCQKRLSHLGGILQENVQGTAEGMDIDSLGFSTPLNVSVAMLLQGEQRNSATEIAIGTALARET